MHRIVKKNFGVYNVEKWHNLSVSEKRQNFSKWKYNQIWCNIITKGCDYMSKHYKTKEFAELLNVSVITLQTRYNDDLDKGFNI